MEPTFRDGDWVLVRRGQHPARGQVVVAEQPPADLPLGARRLPSHVPASATAVPLHRWVVKRVAAVPGDPVPRDRVPALADVPECRVPPGKLILLGDNLRASFDSRRLGYYSVDRVLGVVVRKLTIRRKQPYAGYPPSAAGR